MSRWTPDPSFYPSPRLAMDAPQEKYAYGALVEPRESSRAHRPGGRALPARLRVVRPARRLGGGQGAAALLVRLLVAPRLRHAANERVGNALDGRERRRAREAPRPRVRACDARLGSAQAQAREAA